jgi:sugar phosphate isomerase/epimerase
MAAPLSRRTFLAAAGVGLGAACGSAAEKSPAETFGYCFNTSTIRGQKLPLVQEIEIAARAGFTGLEPWVAELDEHVKSGKSIKDLAKLIRDRGMVVADVIAHAEWIVDDEARRRKGFEEAKRIMGLCQQIGSPHVAAPPQGAREGRKLETARMVDRYGELCKIGASMNVSPALEVWGFSPNVTRLGEAMMIAMESGAANACVLPDVYHLYKGGTQPNALRLLNKDAIAILHVNDYPGIDRAKITDAERVYPGDGVAPLAQIFRDLRAIGYKGMLSLELFNRDYWQKDALAVAVTGMEKLRAAVRASG